MRKTVSLLFTALLTLAFAGSAFAQRSATPQLTFNALLTAAQVVPPTPLDEVTGMTAEARIKFDPGMRFATVFLRIRDNFSSVSGVNLNLGIAGEDGPIVVAVEDFDDPITDRSFTILESFTNGDVIKEGSVKSIPSLYQAVRDGNIYLEVQTLEMFGEIRSQIFQR
jgi:hypothetical protein